MKRNFLIGILLIFIFIIISLYFRMNVVNSTHGKNVVTPSPTFSILNIRSRKKTIVLGKTYASSFDTSSFQYPSNFTKIENTVPTDKTVSFTFSQDANVYRLIVSPPGQINPEGSSPTRVEQAEESYAGRVFIVKKWIASSTPFFIVAIPKDASIPYVFSMQLPPKNTDVYISIFQKILASYTQ